MNLIEGDISGGRFQCPGINVPVGESTQSGAAVLGFRPEDAEIVEPGQGQFDARIFAVELAGDYTLVTAELGDHTVTVKMPMEYSVDYDSNVAVRFSSERGFLFAADSGLRLDGELVEDRKSVV